MHTGFQGQIHVIGEMQNRGLEPVQITSIRVNVFDSQDRLVSSGTAFHHLNVLQPKMSSCFDVALNVGADVGRIEIAELNSIPVPNTAPRLTVIRQQGSYDPTLRGYEVYGEVRNDDTVSVALARVAATLHNAAGLPVGCLVDSLNNIDLASGESSGFNMRTIGGDYTDVVSYTLQLDGTRQ